MYLYSKSLCLGGATENVAASFSCVVFLSSLLVILKKHSVANFRFLTVQLQTFRSNLTFKAATRKSLPSRELQLPGMHT